MNPAGFWTRRSAERARKKRLLLGGNIVGLLEQILLTLLVAESEADQTVFRHAIVELSLLTVMFLALVGSLIMLQRQARGQTVCCCYLPIADRCFSNRSWHCLDACRNSATCGLWRSLASRGSVSNAEVAQ